MLTHGQAAVALQEVLLIQGSMGRHLVPRTACTLSYVHGAQVNLYPLFRHDSTSAETLRANVRSSCLASAIARTIDRRITLRFAAGLEEATFRSADLSPFFGVTREQRQRHYSSVADCASNDIPVPTPEAEDVALSHLESLFYVYVTGVTMAAAVAAATHARHALIACHAIIAALTLDSDAGDRSARLP